MKSTKIFFYLLFILFSFNLSRYGHVVIDNLKCENIINPLGIDDIKPCFSWQMSSAQRNVIQSAYEIQVSDDESFQNLVWESGKINSDKSLFVNYKGNPLQSLKKYYWKVRVWDQNGKVSKWSDAAFWQMGLLNATDWTAQWIESGFNENITQPAPMFRKEFAAKKEIKSAIVLITSHGWYEAEINGKRVGDAYFTPGWTSYKTRLQYQMYDVTSLINTGSNAIGVSLGNGWYREKFLGMPIMTRQGLSLLFQLEITYADGSTETIFSDDSWKSSTGAIVENSLYRGQVYDGRLKKNGWTIAGFDDSHWSNVKVTDLGYSMLIATENEPVKKQEMFKPVQIITTPKGEVVLDFGQNLVGWVKFKASGKAGDMITVSHAEVLDKEGNFYTESLRTAKAEAVYYLTGNGEEILEPKFSFYGFRYIRVDGYSGTINPDDFAAIALYSDNESTGTFTCSDSLVNQLQHNIQWGQKGNFLDVPTDCPQRDERLAWTGDAQVFFRTAAFNMDVYNFFVKWLKDMKIAQKEDGVVPWVIPDVLVYMGGPASGWSDAVTIIPWNMYLAYGDTAILVEMYDNMKAWVGYMQNNSKNDLFTLPEQFGDWLFYSPTPDDYGMAAVTDKDLISQCFYAHSTQLLINAAKVLGKNDDILFYEELLENVKTAFLQEYVTSSGRLVSATQTAYVLALNFDMLPEKLRSQAAKRLVENIEQYDNHLTTGFLGTSYLSHVLTRFGYSDVAYNLLFQKAYPSWLYPVTKGATTIWERWDGIKPDGTLQTPSMNSYNHYSYGAIGDWLYRRVAGLDTDKEYPGYKKLIIKPYVDSKLTYAKASLHTGYGNAGSYWRYENGTFIFEVEVPVNTTAKVYVPSHEKSLITESGKPANKVKEIKFIGYENGYSLFEIGSGKYEFTVISTSG